MKRIRFFLLLLFVFPLLLHAQPPVVPVAETQDNPSIVRSGPSDDFDRIIEIPKGIRFYVEESHNGWSKVRLSSLLSGWIETKSLKMLPQGALPSKTVIRGIKISKEKRDVRLEILESQPGVAISEEWLRPPVLWLKFQNASSAISQIQYDPGDPLVDHVSIWQEASDVVFVRIDLRTLNGYRFIQKDPTHFLVKFKLKPASRRVSLKGLRICLDPGHGGKDTGAIGPTGLLEKEVNLSIAKILARMLENRGAQVVLTRKTDTDLVDDDAPPEEELEARVDVARTHGADLFVSIHCNARPTPGEGRTARGTYVYYYQPQSLSLAWDVARSLQAKTHEPKYAVIFRSFHVIREPDMPAILVETLFISNPDTEARLKNIFFRSQVARGILNGLTKYAHSLYSCMGRKGFALS